jgi:hypothetical protein
METSAAFMAALDAAIQKKLHMRLEAGSSPAMKAVSPSKCGLRYPFMSSNRSYAPKQVLSLLALAPKIARAMKGAAMRSGYIGSSAALSSGAGFEQDHQREQAGGGCLAAIKPMIQRPGLYPEQPRKIIEAQLMAPHEAA